MAIDSGRIEAAVAEILAAIGEDVGRPGLASTPQRVAQAYTEFFAGIGVDPREQLADSAEFLGEGETGELVLLRDIEFRSICEHHLLPFLGGIDRNGTRPRGFSTDIHDLSAEIALGNAPSYGFVSAQEASAVAEGIGRCIEHRHDCGH